MVAQQGGMVGVRRLLKEGRDVWSPQMVPRPIGRTVFCYRPSLFVSTYVVPGLTNGATW